MENNGFNLLPQFPAGLRVLVVDDDPTWLKILQKMLRKCSYEVTTCGLAREALSILRERKDGFDIVISDVNMPDMDGFKLLEHVGLEMDLPVIMMSVDGETSRVMKGIHHGACDYLLKPVRMKELRNIWQHVFRKKRHELKEFESHDKNEDCHLIRSILDEFDDDHVSSECDTRTVKKRKDLKTDEDDEHDNPDPSAVKKVRVVWSVDLHQKFVNAVNQIGLDKVGPKKILDLMQVPGLTRENVASHLQKYRLYLGRLQKENKPETAFGGIMQPACSSLELRTSNSLISVAVSQSSSTTRFSFSDDEIQRAHEEDLRKFNLPITIDKWSLANGMAETSQVNCVFSPDRIIPEMDNPLLQPTTSLHYPEAEATTANETVQQQIPMFKTQNSCVIMQNDCAGLLNCQPCDGLFDQLKGFLPIRVKDSFFCGNATIDAIPVENCIDANELVKMDRSQCTLGLEYSSEHKHNNLFPVQSNDAMLNQQVLGTVSSVSGSTLCEVYELDQKSFNIWESPYLQLVPTEPIVDSPYNEFQFYPLEGYDCFADFGLDNAEILKINELRPKTEIQSCLNIGPPFDCNLCDSEHLVVDERLPMDGDHLFVAESKAGIDATHWLRTSDY